MESIPVYAIRPVQRADEGNPARMIAIPKPDERSLFAIETQKDEAIVFSRTARVNSGDLCFLQRRDGETMLGTVSLSKDSVSVKPWESEQSEPIELKKRDVQFMYRAIRFVKEI